MTAVDLSFIIVNYHTPKLVDALLRSIKAFPPPMPHEVIVVDNSSGDNSASLIRELHPEVTLVRSSENVGFAAGNNLGAERAGGRFLVAINPDCELEKESFAEAVKYLDGHPDVGILGLKVVKPDGEVEQSARGFPSPSTGLFGRSTWLGRLAQRSKLGKTSVARKNLLVDPSATEPYEVDWVAGTAMIIKRECWDAVGGFDEGFFMYWEDADLCYRALEAGHKTVYFPGAHVVHRPGSSAVLNLAPSIRWFHQSAYRYVVKHISPGPSLLRAFAWCALNLRAALLIAKARRKGRNTASPETMS